MFLGTTNITNIKKTYQHGHKKPIGNKMYQNANKIYQNANKMYQNANKIYQNGNEIRNDHEL
jgi:hypothetical protein